MVGLPTHAVMISNVLLRANSKTFRKIPTSLFAGQLPFCDKNIIAHRDIAQTVPCRFVRKSAY